MLVHYMYISRATMQCYIRFIIVYSPILLLGSNDLDL
jgi:hypothetical protein